MVHRDIDATQASGGKEQPPSGGNGGIQQPERDFHPLGEYAEHAYLAYAMSVVKGRAIPDVCDGLKHVQRRILFAMHELGITHVSKPVKSARVVGEVLGKWHPHSDQAAYDAMVRLAQEFSMRYPLITGEGNFGSRDGDNPAAMRYTEAKLSELSELVLSEIDQGTVEYVANYDGTLQEPKLLPARLPLILLNGQTGIGVGLATETPSHNMVEVAQAAVELIKHPRLNTASLMQYIKGPDFPGGGQIITAHEEMIQAYEQGRGSIRLRARWKVEELARGQWRIVVYELPHGVSASLVMQEIDALTNPQPRKGEKDISLAQKNLKQLFSGLIEVLRDESDKEEAVRLVFEPRSSRQDQHELMQALLSHTSLEINYSMNLVVIGIDGKPTQKSLAALLAEWVAFRILTITRRSQYRLGRVVDRIHILEGRRIVYLNIDEVIRIIRSSDQPKEELVKAFNLTEVQANDILDIRLRQLARLEGIRIEQELAELGNEKTVLEELLADESILRRNMIKEIRRDAERYGDDRRTLIQEASSASFTRSVVNEPVTIILSQKGWVRLRSGHGIDLNAQNYKSGDQYLSHVETRSVDQVYFLDELGRAYSVAVANIPGGRGDGVPVATLVDLQQGARVLFMLSGKSEDLYLFSCNGGYGFMASLEDLASRNRSGKTFMTLYEQEIPLLPVRVTNPQYEKLALLSDDYRLLVFALSEVKMMSRGRGLMLMKLNSTSRLINVAVLGEKKLKLVGQGRSGKVVEQILQNEMLDTFISGRAKKGALLGKTLKSPRLG
ncbi:MAG: DNA topoisomerase IV subunit A [Proteobacteria bacterium]|nr:DNA topoisomerase IV subunit A [Pseudomonadota bacterium]